MNIGNNFIKVAAISPEMKLADTKFNANSIIKAVKEAVLDGVKVVVTPELSLTGYSCLDLFLQHELQQSCYDALKCVIDETEEDEVVTIVGMPVMHESKLYNAAVVIYNGSILGVIPKVNIVSNNEFYENRTFTSGMHIKNTEIEILGQKTIISPSLLFKSDNFIFGIEICEDLWVPNNPSISHSLNGAKVIFNLSASPESIGKADYRSKLVEVTSAKLNVAYVYASSGICESSSDLVFSNHLMICENGTMLNSKREQTFNTTSVIAEIDLQKLDYERSNNTNYYPDDSNYEIVEFYFNAAVKPITREYSIYPFVPQDISKRALVCEEILKLQSSGLATRLRAINCTKTVIGISGGLDSTLAFLVVIEAYKLLGIDTSNIIAITMPGFGTTGRTYTNACDLVKEYNATLKEISIKGACIQHFKDIGINENDRSVTYENSQARERTQILMDVANKENAIVIGTGDLSELALGWCTYNGDHMSMYSVNSSIPKTLVRYIVEYVYTKTSSKVLKEILDTPISPELLPPDENGSISQLTEDSVGPYVLHDFFMYHFLRYGASPSKIFYLAVNSFKDMYSKEEILKWLEVFFRRFFTQQFKRNCVPDGVKVGSISLSPRGNFKMPSDASCEVFLKSIKNLM